jgi:hypothetical protein
VTRSVEAAKTGRGPTRCSSRPLRAQDRWFFRGILCSALAAAEHQAVGPPAPSRPVRSLDLMSVAIALSVAHALVTYEGHRKLKGQTRLEAFLLANAHSNTPNEGALVKLAPRLYQMESPSARPSNESWSLRLQIVPLAHAGADNAGQGPSVSAGAGKVWGACLLLRAGKPGGPTRRWS